VTLTFSQYYDFIEFYPRMSFLFIKACILIPCVGFIAISSTSAHLQMGFVLVFMNGIFFFYILSLSLLEVLGFELKALNLLGRCSILSAMPHTFLL
jgi:hypothetical protein